MDANVFESSNTQITMLGYHPWAPPSGVLSKQLPFVVPLGWTGPFSPLLRGAWYGAWFAEETASPDEFMMTSPDES